MCLDRNMVDWKCKTPERHPLEKLLANKTDKITFMRASVVAQLKKHADIEAHNSSLKKIPEVITTSWNEKSKMTVNNDKGRPSVELMSSLNDDKSDNEDEEEMITLKSDDNIQVDEPTTNIIEMGKMKDDVSINTRVVRGLTDAVNTPVDAGTYMASPSIPSSGNFAETPQVDTDLPDEAAMTKSPSGASEPPNQDFTNDTAPATGVIVEDEENQKTQMTKESEETEGIMTPLTVDNSNKKQIW
eukprot:UN25437